LAFARKLRQPVYVAEILVERLFQRELRQPNYRPVPRFPAVDRDFSFLFDAGVAFERIQHAVDAAGIPELREFRPVEILRGDQSGTSLPPNKYAILLRARFQSAERTLRDDEVASWAQQIVRSLEALGGKLRG
jgi:phenylalanyl-tRNA synthetase beta chain